jgi:hypothetical protein
MIRRHIRPTSALIVLFIAELALSSVGPSVVHSQQPQGDELQVVYETAEAALKQLSQAITHTLFAWSALSRGDAPSGIAYSHQVLNILEGPQGEHYDPAYGTPDEGVGDGVGALIHAQKLLELLESSPLGSDYRIAAENVLLFTQWARARVVSALELAPIDEAEAVLELRRAQAMLMAARGSREEVWRPTEGGVRTILAWLAERKSR